MAALRLCKRWRYVAGRDDRRRRLALCDPRQSLQCHRSEPYVGLVQKASLDIGFVLALQNAQPSCFIRTADICRAVSQGRRRRRRKTATRLQRTAA